MGWKITNKIIAFANTMRRIVMVYLVCLDCYYIEQGEEEKAIKEIKLNKFKEIKDRNKNESKN